MSGGNGWKRWTERLHALRYALVIQGLLVGLGSGAAVILFRAALERADALRGVVLAFCREHGWAVPLLFIGLALAALAVSALLWWEPYISGSGIPQVEGELKGELRQVWWRVLAAKFVGGVISVGCGLSLGREGPSIQLGAMAGKGTAALLHRKKPDAEVERYLLSCGASAGLAAAFNAPLAGVLFALEELHGRFSPEFLLSSLASSVTADFLSREVFGLAPVFNFGALQEVIPLGSYGHVLLLGVLLGLFGTLYNNTLVDTQALYARIPWRPVRLLIPFLCAGVLGLVYPGVLGGGHPLTEVLLSNTLTLGALCLLLAAKFGFSMLSFGSGAPGGIFLPLLILGAAVGSVYSRLGVPLGLDAHFLQNCILLGMAGAFSAIVRAPVTGIVLISEMAGGFSHLLSLSIVSFAAYLVPDLLACRPVYDLLLDRLLGRSTHR